MFVWKKYLKKYDEMFSYKEINNKIMVYMIEK